VLSSGDGIGQKCRGGAWLDTRWRASSGHPRCHEQATCVPGLEHYGPPGGMRCNSSVPRCGANSRVVRGSLAGRIREGKKSFSCVTTRRSNLWGSNALEHGLGSLTALLLCVGVPGFGAGVLATLGLPPSRLPATDLPPAFQLLAIALVPTPRQVLAPAPFAETNPRARPAHSGQIAVFCLNVGGAHGSGNSQGKSSGGMCNHSPRALSKRAPDTSSPA
jgi:hypothetical protein